MHQALATSTQEAINRVIVDEPNRLHVGIDDRAADKPETTFLEILRQCIADRARRWHLSHPGPAIHDRFPSHELPDVAIERTELLLYSEKCLRVGHRRVDFEPVADDAGILQQHGFFLRRESLHLLRIELRKRSTIAIPPQQDCFPRKTRLRAFQQQHLEMLPVIVNRHPPLMVMIGDEMRFATDPSAARLTIGDWTEMLGHQQSNRLKDAAAFYTRP